jgi:hypothetical protein
VRDVPVKGEPSNANDNLREHHPVASQPHDRALIPPARTRAQQRPARQRRRECQCRCRRTTAFPAGVPEPGRRSHVAAQLPGASNFRGATSMPAAEDATRGCGGAASKKLRLVPALGVRTSWSTIRPRPEPASFSAAGTRRWGRGRDIDGQESSRTQPRCSEYHRSPATSGKCRRQS